MIFDLSSSNDYSINDNILKKYDSLVYETLENAIRLMTQVSKEIVMIKRDLKSAFRHIPIDSCNY